MASGAFASAAQPAAGWRLELATARKTGVELSLDSFASCGVSVWRSASSGGRYIQIWTKLLNIVDGSVIWRVWRKPSAVRAAHSASLLATTASKKYSRRSIGGVAALLGGRCLDFSYRTGADAPRSSISKLAGASSGRSEKPLLSRVVPSAFVAGAIAISASAADGRIVQRGRPPDSRPRQTLAAGHSHVSAALAAWSIISLSINLCGVQLPISALNDGGDGHAAALDGHAAGAALPQLAPQHAACSCSHAYLSI